MKVNWLIEINYTSHLELTIGKLVEDYSEQSSWIVVGPQISIRNMSVCNDDNISPVHNNDGGGGRFLFRPTFIYLKRKKKTTKTVRVYQLLSLMNWNCARSMHFQHLHQITNIYLYVYTALQMTD